MRRSLTQLCKQPDASGAPLVHDTEYALTQHLRSDYMKLVILTGR